MSNITNEMIKILIVEDSPTQLEKLKYILEDANYQIVCAQNGKQALASLDTFIPTVIISDIIMPEINGYQLCKMIKANDRIWDIPVILMTTLTSKEDVFEGLACGADSFITKPYSESYLLNHIGKFLSKKVLNHNDSIQIEIEIPIAGKSSLVSVDLYKMLNLLIDTYEDAIIKNNELQQYQDKLISLNYDLETIVKEKTEELKKKNEELLIRLQQTIHTISIIGEMKDVYTAGHQRKVALLSCAIAREMKLSEDVIYNISVGALIHDIGKINIPTDILNKPGKISNLEYQILQSHVEYSFAIVKEIDFSNRVIEMIRQHHERLDGSGYPQGLIGDQIILESKILSVADVVEAMSSHRPYRPSLGLDAALEEILKNRGIKFDSNVVDVCIKLFRELEFTFSE